MAAWKAILIFILARCIVRVVLTVNGRSKSLNQLVEDFDGSDEGFTNDMLIFYARRFGVFAGIISTVVAIVMIWVHHILLLWLIVVVNAMLIVYCLSQIRVVFRENGLLPYRKAILTELLFQILFSAALIALMLILVKPGI